MLLVNGATKDVEPLVGHPDLGVLITPGTKGSGPKNDIKRIVGWGVDWAVDNGGFKGVDVPAFLKLLASVAGQPGCLWVAAPDVLGDAAATLAKFQTWGPFIREIGLPVALVAQDGLTSDATPWDVLDSIFIGGTNAWKLTMESAALCAEAKRRGKLVHVGRCNSKVRIKAALAMGADTMDGSQFSWWPGRYIPMGLRWIRESRAELAAWESQQRFGGSVLELAIAAAKPRSGGLQKGPRIAAADRTENGLFDNGR